MPAACFRETEGVKAMLGEWMGSFRRLAMIGVVAFCAALPGRAPAAEPQRGGSAVIAVDSAFAMLNTQVTSATPAQVIADLWADGLYARDGKGQKVPRLAKSWSVSDDQLVYTFMLRSGVKWSDGQPFSAEDAKFTLERLSPLNTYMASIMPNIDKVEAPDATTFVVHLKKPLAAMLEVFNKETFPLMPKHIYENGDPATNPANRMPVGLGPYRLKSWEQGRQLVFVRNENYWDQPKPYLDEVVVALIPNPQQQVNALIKGEVDWAMLTYSQVERAREAAKSGKIEARRLQFGSPFRLSLDFNLRKTPLSDARLRQALFMATDRQRIVADAYHGLAYPETNVIPAQFVDLSDPSVDYGKLYPYDPARANKMLDEAGYPMRDGKRLSLEFAFGGAGTPNGAVFADVANILSAEWKEIGVELRLVSLDQALWLQKVYEKHDFDLALGSLTATFDPTFGVDRSYVCNDTTLPYKNPTGYCNKDLDAVAAKANSAKWSDRKGFYKQYAEIVARDLSEISLTNAGQTHAVSTRFENFEKLFDVSFDEYPNWAEVWIDPSKK
jgi:peptide/nickel transport system substrate-binding protein